MKQQIVTLTLAGLCGAALLLRSGAPSLAGANAPRPPSPMREFRAVWVATVDNIDWPSKPGLPVEQQKQELLAILDRTAELRMNAVVLQVRPTCDALYKSDLEPWSEYLTGKQGEAPSPFYDPLEFAVKEAHARGLELHAWINPYRARHPSTKGENSADHVSRKRPELVRTYGKHLWMDPGDPRVQKHSLDVVRDLVRRYDLDGIHMDDYFYPYKEKDAVGVTIPFPDDPSWQAYVNDGGTLSRDDWRRENVNSFVKRMHDIVKEEKKWVKFGISPFGIWRPGHPPQIQGFDQYSELYADAKKWLIEGWVDYWTPQLYWPIAQQAQSYPVLLKWWTEQNPHHRHIWPGNYTGRVGDGSARAFPVEEVPNQILATRAQPGATGNVHFSMKVFMQNRQGLNDALLQGVYAEPALVPATPWLDATPPAAPKLKLTRTGTGDAELTWDEGGREKAWLWVARFKSGDTWTTQIFPSAQTSRLVASLPAGTDTVALSAVDRCGNESTLSTLAVK